VSKAILKPDAIRDVYNVFYEGRRDLVEVQEHLNRRSLLLSLLRDGTAPPEAWMDILAPDFAPFALGRNVRNQFNNIVHLMELSAVRDVLLRTLGEDAIYEPGAWPCGTEERGDELQRTFLKLLDGFAVDSAPRALMTRLLSLAAPYDLVGIMNVSRLRTYCHLLGVSAKKTPMHRHVALRQHLRQILGGENGEREAVERCHFFHFLEKHPIAPELLASVGYFPPLTTKHRYARQPRQRAASSETQQAAARTAPEMHGGDAPSPIHLSPTPWTGFGHFADNPTLLCKVVHAARHGIAQENLKLLLRREAAELIGAAPEVVLVQASLLGLVAVEGQGIMRLTAEGERLLEDSPDLSPILDAVVAGVAGVAHLLLDAADKKGAIPVPADPRLTDAAAWCRDLGLLAERENVLGLTDAGHAVVARIDRRTPLWQPPAVQANPVTTEPVTLNLPPTDRVVNWINEHGGLNGCEDMVRRVCAVLPNADRRFLLFAGLSGTGKSRLAEKLAEAWAECLGVPEPERTRHFLKVPVLPDWADPSGLLGYVNILPSTPRYESTPCIDFLIRAGGDPKHPYVLCLDEMNLARVEHYLAPFLSAIDRHDAIRLHNRKDLIDPPAALPWPKNLIIIGTANMDHMGHPLPHKVLDRLFTFEFWKVDLEGWHKTQEAEIKKGKEGAADKKILDAAFRYLATIYTILEPVRQQFGYRTCDDVLRMVRNAVGPSPAVADIRKAFDHALHAKVLPKLSGPATPQMHDQLRKLLDYLKGGKMGESETKVAQMMTKGVRTISYWH